MFTLLSITGVILSKVLEESLYNIGNYFLTGTALGVVSCSVR